MKETASFGTLKLKFFRIRNSNILVFYGQCSYLDTFKNLRLEVKQSGYRMAYVFSKLILNQVKSCMSEDPSEADVLRLFQIFEPELVSGDIRTKHSRTPKWKEIKD